MSGDFDSKNVQLSDFYADGFRREKLVKAYDNGKMQVVVYPTVMYNGPDTHKKQVIKYVLDNVVIGTQVGANINSVTWVKSSTSNEYSHIIGSPSGQQDAADLKSYISSTNIRVPIYFTVPEGSTGKHYWVATLGDVTTNIANPITVEVVHYSPIVCPEDIEIVDIAKIYSIEIRAMQYKHNAVNVPSGHRLFRYIGKDGIRFFLDNDRDSCSAWIPMIRSDGAGANHSMCGFLDYRRDTVIFYEKRGNGPNGIFNPSQYTADKRIGIWNNPREDIYILVRATNRTYYFFNDDKDQFDRAWNRGIVMCFTPYHNVKAQIGTGEAFPLTYEIRDNIRIEDNFGNEFVLKIDWDTDGKYFETWKVTEFKNAN